MGGLHYATLIGYFCFYGISLKIGGVFCAYFQGGHVLEIQCFVFVKKDRNVAIIEREKGELCVYIHPCCFSITLAYDWPFLLYIILLLCSVCLTFGI